jgi:hypothetical protein
MVGDVVPGIHGVHDFAKGPQEGTKIKKREGTGDEKAREPGGIQKASEGYVGQGSKSTGKADDGGVEKNDQKSVEGHKFPKHPRTPFFPEYRYRRKGKTKEGLPVR